MEAWHADRYYIGRTNHEISQSDLHALARLTTFTQSVNGNKVKDEVMATTVL